MSQSANRILVTGGTGRTGVHLVRTLVERGYAVRAVTSREPPSQPDVEWRRMDWHRDIDFSSVVDGCSAVLHLGAELSDIPKMHRANVEATEALVASAERAGVKFFCYTSTISVYGSPRKRIVTEESPVVTTAADARREYLAEDFFRAYARTKLLGEKAILAGAKDAGYVIFRPTVIVDIGDILDVGNWSWARRLLFAYRHSHHIYVADVVHAILWFMERALANDRVEPDVRLYNLSNDDVDYNTYAHLFRRLYEATGDKRFFCPVHAPGVLDMVRVMVKYRSRELRYPPGMLRFSTDKLYAAGYRHAVGISAAQDRAIRDLTVMATAAPRPPQ